MASIRRRRRQAKPVAPLWNGPGPSIRTVGDPAKPISSACSGVSTRRTSIVAGMPAERIASGCSTAGEDPVRCRTAVQVEHRHDDGGRAHMVRTGTRCTATTTAATCATAPPSLKGQGRLGTRALLDSAALAAAPGSMLRLVDYLPLLTNWMQSPWFLKRLGASGAPLVLYSANPPFLQSS